jgi:hypothetical protein
MNPKLGRLQKVPLRTAWTSEAYDFTPWVAVRENLELLSEAIGIELELESQETNVGPFRADILCKDVATDHWVLVENQLERTDHSHLGQLITYAAGLDAVSIVWVAERFTEEHRAALDWLNQHTEEGINFFALEVELWRIGDSPPAPKFNVVSKPNEWTRSVVDSARNTEVNQLRLNYWSAFAKRPELEGLLAAPLKPNRMGHLNLPAAWRNFRLTVYMDRTGKRLGVSLTCRGDDGIEHYRQLVANKTQIENTLGAELRWGDNVTKNEGWATWRLSGNDANLQSDWPRQHQLLAKKAVEFHRAFNPFIEEFERPISEGS